MNNFKNFFTRSHQFGKLGLYVDSIEQNLIEEGLTTSYPFEAVRSMLGSTYGKNIAHIRNDIFDDKSNTAGISLFLKNKIVTDSLIADLKNKLKVYGYFIAYTENLRNETGFFIEPKFSFQIDKQLLRGKKCFHTTSTKYLNKIQKIGLIPRNSQTHFEFDGSRIYLMFSNNERYIRSFQSVLANSKNWNPSDMVLLEILDFDNLTLWFDMNFEQSNNNIATFTFENIRPDNLKVLN